MVQQVLRQADSALAFYCADENRQPYADRLAAFLRTQVDASEAGSDHQLAFLRGLISVAAGEHLDFLQGLLDGTVHVEGLSVDTDLRWGLLKRLVATGRADGTAIDAELQRDDTAAGRLHAASARAAVPTPQAKAAAWTSVLDDASLPNHMLTAIIGGITIPEHRELLRPHVEQYFTALPEVWKTRTNEIAQEITLGLYPASLVEAATVERTDAMLDGVVDIPHGARRLLAEGRDGVLRALRCQQRDGV